MPGPWERYGGQATPTNQPPAVIYGAPDPFKVSGEQRAQQDQALQIETFNRGARSEARADDAAYRSRLEWEATHNPDGTPKPNAGNPTEAQSKVGTLLTRIQGGFNDIQSTVLRAPDAQEPGYIETFRGGLDPNGVTAPAARAWAGADRRIVADSQRDVLDALLTLGTGAAYNREQLDGQLASYFPALNDTQEEIAVKNNRLQRLIAAARVQAGPLADKLDAAVAPYMQSIEQKNLVPQSTDAPPADANTLTSAVRRADGQFDLTWGDGRKQVSDSIPMASSVTADIAPPPTDEQRNSVLGTVDAAVRGIADTVTLGYADEIAAAGNTLFGGGTYDQQLARERGIDRQDERVNPYARIGGQIAGGFALPVGAATGARGLARVGAIYGAGYGTGSADGGAYDRLVGGLQGGAVGGAVGAGLGGLSRLIPRGGGGGPTGGRGADVMRAGQELGVTPLPADVGGPLTGRLTAGVAQTVGGAGPIVRGAQRVQQGAADALSGIAAAEGTPVRQEVLGETAQRAAQGYIDQSGRVGGELYREARNLAGNTRIQGRQALDTLDQNIAELAQTPNTSAPVVAGLQRFRDDLAVTLENGATGRRRLPVDAIRALRTNVRAEAQTDALRATDYQRRANQVLDALSEDIASQLSPEARQAFQRADQAWAERLNVIDDVMSQVIGPQGDRSAEAVAQRLANMSRGDSARLRTFINNVNQEEAGVIRGSLIQELGRSASGQQNAAGDAFSLGSFLTNWDRLPDRTRQILFRGDSRQAIENLATLAEGSRNAARFANTSNTGGATNAGNLIQGMSAITGYGTAGATLALENITARMLASPAVARIIARPPSDRGRLIRRLTEAGVRDPAVQPDISRFVQALETGPGRAAAQEDSQ